MSAGPIGALASALARGARTSRTFQPVRRDTRHAGDRELRRWRQTNMFGREEHNARMRAAEQFERDTKLPGKRNGALGHIALEVLRTFLRLRGRHGGRLDPTIRWVARTIRRARSAVSAALGRLKQCGFIDWDRRSRVVDDPSRPDQYVEQISNAYYLIQPPSVVQAVNRMLRRPTDAARRAAEQLARDKKLSETDVSSLIESCEDPELRETLQRLAALVDSANPPSGQTSALPEQG